MWVVQMYPEEDYNTVVETLATDNSFDVQFSGWNYIISALQLFVIVYFPYQPVLWFVSTFGLQELPWLSSPRHSVHRTGWVWEIISNRQPLQSCERGGQISGQNSSYPEPPGWWLTRHNALDGDEREQSRDHCVSGHQGRSGRRGEGLRVK